MLVFFVLGNAKVLSFALGNAKLPDASSFASQWNIGLKSYTITNLRGLVGRPKVGVGGEDVFKFLYIKRRTVALLLLQIRVKVMLGRPPGPGVIVLGAPPVHGRARSRSMTMWFFCLKLEMITFFGELKTVYAPSCYWLKFKTKIKAYIPPEREPHRIGTSRWAWLGLPFGDNVVISQFKF